MIHKKKLFEKNYLVKKWLRKFCFKEEIYNFFLIFERIIFEEKICSIFTCENHARSKDDWGEK